MASSLQRRDMQVTTNIKHTSTARLAFAKLSHLFRFCVSFPFQQAADDALLSLQSKTTEALMQSVLTRHLVTDQMHSYLKRLQLDLSTLKVIHVAGTKGKGSTCAFSESIMRHCGFTTGLFTSPHLIHTTERFKINGKTVSSDTTQHPLLSTARRLLLMVHGIHFVVQISDDLYLKHFWAVWDRLHETAVSSRRYRIVFRNIAKFPLVCEFTGSN
jgi:hypothetical protein